MLADGTALAWPIGQAFMADDGYALREAAIAGAGLVLQPEVLLAKAVQDGELIAVLDRFLPPPLPVHLVDFLLAELGPD